MECLNVYKVKMTERKLQIKKFYVFIIPIIHPFLKLDWIALHKILGFWLQSYVGIGLIKFKICLVLILFIVY